jgi:hypothetical protein
MEYLEPDSNILEAPSTQSKEMAMIPKEKTIECSWCWKDSVLRAKTGLIIGIPRYSDWKHCIEIRKDCAMKAKIRWNALLKKY